MNKADKYFLDTLEEITKKEALWGQKLSRELQKLWLTNGLINNKINNYGNIYRNWV